MAIVKFKPNLKAYSGKLYQKLLGSSTKQTKLIGRQGIFKGGTPEYYRKKYRSLYGRVRHSPLGEKVVEKAREKLVMPIKQRTKFLKGHIGSHWKAVKEHPTGQFYGTVLPIAGVWGATIPLAVWDARRSMRERAEAKRMQDAVRTSERKTRSDKGKKRGKYRT